MNQARRRTQGEFVLYWMQSTHRLEENWGLRYAILAADRLGLPVIVHQGLDPTYEHASDRIHHFILSNAREMAARASGLGITYRFALRRTRDDDRRVVDRLAARAALVVTDDFPTCGIAQRTSRFAARTECRVIGIDSHGIFPNALFPKEEWAARTVRPRMRESLVHALYPVEDRAPMVAASDPLVSSLDPGWIALDTIDIDAEIARCEIDHAVFPVSKPSGLQAARARLHAFCTESLPSYEERRANPADATGSSCLSPYLHFGQISAAEVARAALGSGELVQTEKFLDELVTWRELSLNFCSRNAKFGSLEALPQWVHENMKEHAKDRREADYSIDQLEKGETHEPLWNAAQQELRTSGAIHNVMRMYWGKGVLQWKKTYAAALADLIHLNNKWALDGRDPSSYAGIQWCFGKFDRPWARRPVYGTIRYMSLARAEKKFDAAAYVRRVSSGEG